MPTTNMKLYRLACLQQGHTFAEPTAVASVEDIHWFSPLQTRRSLCSRSRTGRSGPLQRIEQIATRNPFAAAAAAEGLAVPSYKLWALDRVTASQDKTVEVPSR
jgi:hypothetical protein